MAVVASLDSLRVIVLGGGSWGTSLAVRCAAKHPVSLWVRSEEAADHLRRGRENHKYLPGVELPGAINITASLEDAVAPKSRPGQSPGERSSGGQRPSEQKPAERRPDPTIPGRTPVPSHDHGTSIVILAVPADAVRGVVTAARPLLTSRPGTILVSAAKGFEAKTHLRMSEVVAEVLGGDTHDASAQEPGRAQPHLVATATLSGPCFAAELARGVVTAAVVASHDLEVAQQVQYALASDTFRLYSSSDVVGVEIGGAVKNVIAIAAGCVDGLGAGLNTRAALITRGLAEMARLAEKLGGDPRTLAGLAGLGDLMLTCTGDLSRNRRFGFAVGQGHTAAEALALVGQVVEGMAATQAALALGRRAGVDLPITEQIHRVLFDGATPARVLRDLMQRALKDELG